MRRPSGERWIEYLDEDGARLLRCKMPDTSHQVTNPTTSTLRPRSPNQYHYPQDGRPPPLGGYYTSPPGPSPPSPILPAKTLEDDLYQHFKNLPPPAHLRDQPRAAIIWRWAKWLVEARGIEQENAQVIAESHVDYRWQDVDAGVRGAEYSVQPDHEDLRNPWTQWEYDPPMSHPGERKDQANETQRQYVRLSAAQLNAMQTAHTGYTPPASPAKPNRYHPEPTFGFDYTANPAQASWEIPRNSTATNNTPVATIWEQTTYQPDSAPYPPPGSFPHDPHRIPADDLATHLTNAIKAALRASPNATGPDLYLHARFRVPIPVARSIASGAIEGNAANILTSLAEVNTFVPVTAAGAGDTQVKGGWGGEYTRETPRQGNPWPTRKDSRRGRGRSRSKIRYKTPEEMAQEEEAGWNEVRTPKAHWPY